MANALEQIQELELRIRQLKEDAVLEVKEKLVAARRAVADLENFKQLQTLWVAETKLGDEGIQHFKPLTQLKDITLYGTRVTDTGAEVLLGLPNLVSMRCGPHMNSDGSSQAPCRAAQLPVLALRADPGD